MAGREEDGFVPQGFGAARHPPGERADSGLKGIVLAGGSGSRLYPLTRITNKHLLPVYSQPMIHYPIQLLVSAGVDSILIVTGGKHAGEFLPLLGEGGEFGLRHLDFTFQERPAGIADALRLARPFAGGDSVCVVLADNIFEYSIAASAGRFLAQGDGARILLAEVEHPESYGVPLLDGDRIVRIEEKPVRPLSRYVVTGCYFYDAEVFDIVERLRPSPRGELEITDVNNAYLARGRLEYDIVDGYWADCGESFDSYLRASNLVATRGANKEVRVREAALR